MAIEAPISKFTKTNLMIYIAVCLGLTLWCVYDGHFNQDFIDKYTDADGNATGWLSVNRTAPPYLIGAAVILGVYLLVVRNRKLIADENELIISDKVRIPYESIERIDKTHFESKGYFVVTYKNKNGNEVDRRISSRRYDNLAPVLDHLVAKIT